MGVVAYIGTWQSFNLAAAKLDPQFGLYANPSLTVFDAADWSRSQMTYVAYDGVDWFTN